ncbi:MAG TPA: phosphatase PAP2 family protein [Pyrinomonadaceae bacterium]|jgi:membrane-associated phospholipid phosphatase|nr:phosphatase PAP2 family protein [Pyrinomonadaceae bacterium]
MGRRIPTAPWPRRVAVVFTFVTLASASAFAQVRPAAQPSPLPSPSPAPTPQAGRGHALQKNFFKNILADQRDIWTSPLRASGGDAKWLVPLGGATAALLATDHQTACWMDSGGLMSARMNLSRDVSYVGSPYGTGAVAATFYLFGLAKHDSRAKETGILAGEAMIDTSVVVGVFKGALRRSRPMEDDSRGKFFNGGAAFPSGHSSGSWALATVVANEYGRDRKLVRFGAYGFAAAVGLARYTGRAHFLSDVLVGGAIGYSVGRFVYVKHHNPDLDRDSNRVGSLVRSKYFPMIAPSYDAGGRGGREYGVSLAWNF